MAEKKRIVWIDQLRALAFYFVILGHMSIGKKLKNWIYSFHMPLFFFISGLNLNMERIYKTPFTKYFSKLFKRMVVPYVWLQMLSFIFRYAVSLINGKSVPVLGYFKGIFVGNSLIIGSPSNPMYYILLLFAVQVCLWFVIKLSKADKLKTGIILTLLLLISLLTKKTPLVWHINVVPVGMMLIFVGRLLMDAYLLYREKIENLNKGTLVLISLGLVLFGYVISVLNGRISIHGNYYGKDFIIALVCSVATSAACAFLTMLIPKNKFFTFVGQNTLFYLSIHQPLLYVMEALAGEYEDNWVFILAGSIFCFLILAPMAWFADKFFPYICGNPIKEETSVIKIGKFLAVGASGVVMWIWIINNLFGGVLVSSTAMKLLAITIYAVIVVIGVYVFEYLMPFMFGKDYSGKSGQLFK